MPVRTLDLATPASWMLERPLQSGLAKFPIPRAPPRAIQRRGIHAMSFLATLNTAILVTTLALLTSPAAAQTPGPTVTVGGGLSFTRKGAPLSSALTPGVGGRSLTVLFGGGYEPEPRVFIGGELSLAPAFDSQQTEGGVGRCCNQLSRRNKIWFLSALAKLQLPATGIRIVGGIGSGTISTDSVSQPIGRSGNQVSREASYRGVALVSGAEASLGSQQKIRVVPAVRFYYLHRDDAKLEDPLGIGKWTTRTTISLEFGH